MVYARASLERIQIKGTRQILILTVISMIMTFLKGFWCMTYI